MKIYEVLNKLDPTTLLNVYLVVTYSSSRTARTFLLDIDRIKSLRRWGWLRLDPDPYTATVLRIYVRDGSITLTAKFHDKKKGE